jgi:hypothetical protein
MTDRDSVTAVLDSADGTLTIRGRGKMKDFAWFNTTSIINVVIANEVTYIGNYAFKHCGRIKSVTISNSVEIIGQYAFSNTGLISITIPNSVATIKSGAFAYCERLKSIILSNNVTEIDAYVFLATGLRSIIIPNSVTKIGAKAFAECKFLTSIIIPNSVTYIGRVAFENCINLKSITVLNPIPPKLTDGKQSGDAKKLTPPAKLGPDGKKYYAASWTPLPEHWWGGTFRGVDKGICTLYVPKGSENVYRLTEGWNEFQNIKSIE